MLRYRAKYWRNDGEFHQRGYNPDYVFNAPDDASAIKKALAYIKRKRQGNEEFSILKLEEIKVRNVPLSR
ncbi:MAG: hypothetical protein WC641_02145 [Patescibacteria group bacterium]